MNFSIVLFQGPNIFSNSIIDQTMPSSYLCRVLYTWMDITKADTLPSTLCLKALVLTVQGGIISKI